MIPLATRRSRPEELYVVEDVECLRAQLHRHPPAQRRRLLQRKISVVRAWPVEEPWPRIAQRTQRRTVQLTSSANSNVFSASNKLVTSTPNVSLLKMPITQQGRSQSRALFAFLHPLHSTRFPLPYTHSVPALISRSSRLTPGNARLSGAESPRTPPIRTTPIALRSSRGA